MSTPAEYREFALGCMREAECADSASMRLAMIDLARMWMRVALQMEQHVDLAGDDPHHRTDAP